MCLRVGRRFVIIEMRWAVDRMPRMHDCCNKKQLQRRRASYWQYQELSHPKVEVHKKNI